MNPTRIEPEPVLKIDELIEQILGGMLKHVRVIPDAKVEAQRQRGEAARRETRTAELRRNWGAPHRHVAVIADRAEAWGQKLADIEARLGTGRMWALTGVRGNGKTQLAVEVMKTATAMGMTATYTSAIRLFAEIKATYRRDATETEIQVVDRYRKVKLLVIDEIGKRGETDWESNLLFELLNNRYGDMTDTILVANLGLQELATSLGPSLSGRLNETGGVIHCDWPSRR